MPAWLAGQALNTWFAITGTSGAGGASLNAFSGLGQLGTKWVSACSGGHGDGLDNRVTTIDLSADTPAWATLKAASSGGASDIAYYSDGKPASRHTYHSIFGVTGNRIVLPGLRFTAGGAYTFDTNDAFNLTTNQWVGVVPDSPGTSGSGLANVSPSGYYPVAQDHNGDLWCVLYSNGNVAKYAVATNTWSQPTMTNKVASNVRYPWSLDTTRNQLFGLCWGDGEGAPDQTGIRAVVLDYVAGTQRAISFSAGSSAAVTQFTSDKPEYPGMDYDPINDRFLFCTGTGRVYIVHPNSGTTWDLSIQSGAGSLPSVSAPVCKKVAYFPALKVIAVMPDVNQNIYCMRLA